MRSWLTFHYVVCAGDIFGPSLDHLDRLIQMPYGCGEQNMVRFAPAVFAATYLNITGRFAGPLEKRVRRILATGNTDMVIIACPVIMTFNSRKGFQRVTN